MSMAETMKARDRVAGFIADLAIDGSFKCSIGRRKDPVAIVRRLGLLSYRRKARLWLREGIVSHEGVAWRNEIIRQLDEAVDGLIA